MKAQVVILGLAFAFTAAARGDILIDDFTCSDSVNTSGAVFASSVIPCEGSIGGFRDDVIFFSGGAGNNASSLTSNPPPGTISGNIGAGLTGQDVFLWSGSGTSGVWDLPDLDLVDYSVIIAVESPSGGTLDVTLGSGPTAANNFDNFAAVLPVSPDFADVLIPLTDPIASGMGADLSNVTAIGLHVDVAGGGSWSIDEVSAVAPEPSTLWPTGMFSAIAWLVFRPRRSELKN